MKSLEVSNIQKDADPYLDGGMLSLQSRDEMKEEEESWKLQI